MTRGQLTFAAAFSRLLLGSFAVVVLPMIYPRTRELVGPLVVYVLLAFGLQLLVWKEKGGGARAVVGGVIDALAITYAAHLVGSTETVLPSLYVLVGVMNALVAGKRTVIFTAGVQVLAYSVVVAAEYFGQLPSAPGGPLAATARPTFEAALSSIALVAYLVVTATSVVGFLAYAVEVREQQLLRANAKLEDLSQRDPLTGLFNRRHLFARIEHEVARHRRGHPLALVMLDLDRFKSVNDTQGHLRGDLLLRELGAAMTASTRVVDVVARYGGDEFVLLLPDTDEAQAKVVADRVVTAVRAVGRQFADDSSGEASKEQVTASVGLAIARREDNTATLIRRADDAAYLAKRAGGDRYETEPSATPAPSTSSCAS